ncbi:MAG TPA: DUF2911 domain-containing protein [Flavitalea sp.]|nr:DUF2911 domain-containing protein [Flavitalea sp.]
MKHLLLLTAVAFCFLGSSAQNPPLSPKASAAGKGVKVAYSQPSKRDRVIFGELVPYGKVWRTGANEATEITFDKDVTFGGKSVKAGTYSLFTIPNENEWTVILNSQLHQEGSSEYEKYKDKNVAEITVPSTKTGKVVEKLTFSFNDKNDMTIAWDDRQITVPIK